MTKIVLTLSAVFTFSIVAAAAAYLVLVFDPFKWGVVQSSGFTWEKFRDVKEGDRIESVIARLGEPVHPVGSYGVLTKNPLDPCVRNSCKEYVFAGALWGATFREAIVIADSEGRVIYAIDRKE